MGDWPVLSHSKFGPDDITFNPYSVTVTPHASANTKSVYTQVVAAAPFDVAGILLECQLGGNTTALVDIAVGAAASEQVVIPNYLLVGNSGSTHVMEFRFIPIAIRKGERIAIRFQANGGGAYFHLKVQLLASGGFADLQSPSKWAAWGAVAATSTGTVVTAHASANTKGNYVQLIAATALTSRWIILGIGRGSIVDMATDIAIGGAGSEVVILPNFYGTSESAATGGMLLPFTILKGTRVSARCAGSGGASTVQVHIMGGC